jgi:hypothetical protein
MKMDEDEGRQPRKYAQYGIPAALFVRVWETSASAEEAALKLKMPKPIVVARASNYRQKGVQLKKMPRGPYQRRLDVACLNRLIEQLAKDPS